MMFNDLLNTIHHQLSEYLIDDIHPKLYNQMIASIINNKKEEDVIKDAISKTQYFYYSYIIEINDEQQIEIPAYFHIIDLVYIIMGYFNHNHIAHYGCFRDDQCYITGSFLCIYDTLYIEDHIFYIRLGNNNMWLYKYKIEIKEKIKHDHIYQFEHMDQELYKKYKEAVSNFDTVFNMLTYQPV